MTTNTDYVLGHINGEIWKTLPVIDAAKTAGVLRQTNANVTAERIRNRRMSCQLRLERDGASIIVRRYSYHLDGDLGARTP